MKIIYEKDGFGNLTYFSMAGAKNYISSRIELENIREKEGAEGVVLPFGSIGYDITIEGHDFSREPDFVPNGEGYVFEDGKIKITKYWIESGDEIVLKVNLENTSPASIIVNKLYVSIPFNNNYTRYMYNQKYMYNTKTCEHYYICGQSSYIIAEKLNGKQPLMYVRCGDNTALEYICKSPQTSIREARGVTNHSYPGSLHAYFVAGKLTENLPNTPKSFEKGSYLTLSKGEKTTFELKLGIATNRAEFDALRVKDGDIVVNSITGMIQPKGEKFVVDVLSNSDVSFGGDVEEIEKISSSRYSSKIELKFC